MAFLVGILFWTYFIREEHDYTKILREICYKKDVLIGTECVAFITLVGMMLTVYMYTVKLGITGIPQYHLPYHLTGIFNLVRLLIMPILCFLAFSFAREKYYALVWIIGYSYLLGLTSNSRALPAMILMPALFVFLLKKKVLGCISVWIAYFIIYICVTSNREIIFYQDIDEYNIWDIIVASVRYLLAVKVDDIIVFSESGLIDYMGLKL